MSDVVAVLDMPSRPLTVRQRDILEYIAREIEVRHRAPTLREIGARFGITSTNGVNDHLRALVSKGCLARDHTVARGMYLTTAGKCVLGIHLVPVEMMPKPPAPPAPHPCEPCPTCGCCRHR